MQQASAQHLSLVAYLRPVDELGREQWEQLQPVQVDQRRARVQLAQLPQPEQGPLALELRELALEQRELELEQREQELRELEPRELELVQPPLRLREQQPELVTHRLRFPLQSTRHQSVPYRLTSPGFSRLSPLRTWGWSWSLCRFRTR